MSELSTATTALTLAATEMKEAKESFENALFDINKKATEAIKVLGSNKVNYYVDPENGNDTNSGVSIDTPFKSLDQAMQFAISPELSGAYIYIYLIGGFDYHINKDYELFHRSVSFRSLSKESNPNIYIDPKVVSSTYKYFGTYGISLFNSSFDFYYCNVFSPLFSEVEGHDSVLTSSQGGIFRPVQNSFKQINFKHCELYVGDQWIVVPSPGDNTMVNFSNTNIHLRNGRVTENCPISLNSSTPLIVNFYSTSLHDDMKYTEGSFFKGVKFKNSVVTNILTNVEVFEA